MLTLSVRKLLRGHLLLYVHVWLCIICLLLVVCVCVGGGMC